MESLDCDGINKNFARLKIQVYRYYAIDVPVVFNIEVA